MKKLMVIGGALYVFAIAIAVAATVLATYSVTMREMVEEGTPVVVTNSNGIIFELAVGYEVPHCTAVAAQAVLAHIGYEVNAARIAEATCRTGMDCASPGRYMHNAVDIMLDHTGDDQFRRELSYATTVEELVGEMIASQASAAMVSVEVPDYYHAVAVVVEQDGTWRAIDAAMTLEMIYGGQNHANIDAWDGSIRVGQNWFFTPVEDQLLAAS